MKGKLFDGTAVEIKIGHKVTTVDNYKGYVHFWTGPDSFAVILDEPFIFGEMGVSVLGFKCRVDQLLSVNDTTDHNKPDDYAT